MKLADQTPRWKWGRAVLLAGWALAGLPAAPLSAHSLAGAVGRDPVAHEPGRRMPHEMQIHEAARASAPDARVPDVQRDPALWSALAASVRTGRLAEDLDYLATELRTRHSYTPQMELACDYAKAAFELCGYPAWFDPFTHSGHALKNVVAVKEGILDPDRIYVVGGHLDSTSPDPQNLAPGADDNGSGAAAVLEIARLLAPVETDYTIYFICFSAEEQGLVGSEHFAQQADLQNLDIRGVLNMDMIAYQDPAGEDLWLEGFYDGASSVWMMDLLEQIAGAYTDVAVFRYPNNGFGSDHVPFHEHGYPAILSIENEWDSNPCYHRTCDRADRLDPWLWGGITAINAIAAGQLAQVRDLAGSIAGQVTVAGGGDPSDTELTLVGTGYAPLITTGGGTFAWEAVFPGSYTLAAQRTGCWPETVAVAVTSGAVAAPTIALEPLVAGAVSGTVRAPDGTPLSGALVEIEGQPGVVQSDPDGTYTLAPAWPGHLHIAASLPDRLPRGIALDLGQGQMASGVDFTLAPTWDFEASPEGLLAGTEWAWGTDAAAGAHSGTRLWGTRLGGNYAHCADDRLDLPPFSLAGFQQATLRLWTWYQAEDGYDGGHLKVSTDGGETWEVVTPAESYDGVPEGTCNPIDGEPAFTGNSAGWVQRTFSLDPFAGQWVRVRLHFGSDSGTAARGWYVDDFTFAGEPSGSAVATPDEETALALHAPRLSAVPNPTRSGTVVRLELPRAQRGRLGIFAADGRRIALLAPWGGLAPGAHAFTWSGRDDRGRQVPAGLYWVRWSAAGADSRARLLLVK